MSIDPPMTAHSGTRMNTAGVRRCCVANPDRFLPARRLRELDGHGHFHNPGSVSAGSAALTLTSMDRFSGGSTVRWNGVNRATTF